MRVLNRDTKEGMSGVQQLHSTATLHRSHPALVHLKDFLPVLISGIYSGTHSNINIIFTLQFSSLPTQLEPQSKVRF